MMNITAIGSTIFSYQFCQCIVHVKNGVGFKYQRVIGNAPARHGRFDPGGCLHCHAALSNS